MKKFLSVILMFLVSFGFTAKLMQLDKLSGTELIAKECNEADESGEKEKKENEAKENIAVATSTGFFVFSPVLIQVFDQAFFAEGFESSPYTPPDRL